jgi:hypothetical protein
MILHMQQAEDVDQRVTKAHNDFRTSFWCRYFLVQSKRGGKAQAIRTKIILLFDEDSLKQEILCLSIHKI